ncbi:hypothetical protein [Halalkalicoccus salilacus]|uniref:hypothetical protein n=1 Tax=Halalkalicoccus TaxID=332246 RepID=UPI002F969182
MENDTEATFEQHETIDVDAPTLIEGLPGHGLVASITEEQAGEIRQQMQQIAEQYQQASEKQRQQEDVRTGMYQ